MNISLENPVNKDQEQTSLSYKHNVFYQIRDTDAGRANFAHQMFLVGIKKKKNIIPLVCLLYFVGQKMLLTFVESLIISKNLNIVDRVTRGAVSQLTELWTSLIYIDPSNPTCVTTIMRLFILQYTINMPQTTKVLQAVLTPAV